MGSLLKLILSQEQFSFYELFLSDLKKKVFD